MKTTTGEKLDLECEEAALVEECRKNIIRNIQRSMMSPEASPQRISQLLSMKWYLENDVKVKTN